MPFRTFTWEDGSVTLGRSTPDPELRQVDDEQFVILESFCYRAVAPDPDEGTVVLVPGEDFAAPPGAGSKPGLVVPPKNGGRTDLASVPSLFWWLIASYGNHTRASLMHDALYVEKGDPPVPRRTADRLFLSALREQAPVEAGERRSRKGGAFRHWLMWAAVSAFGTMRWKLGYAFAAHLVAVWALTIWAVAWAWGDGLAWVEWSPWQIALAVILGLVFLAVLGASWRTGVDVRRGWLLPMALTTALIVVPLANEWTYPLRWELSPFTLLAGALALTLLGLLWGLWVDPTLRGWLWPTALIALPIAVVPAVLIVAAILLVWLVDLGASVAASFRKTPSGEDRPFELPKLEVTTSRV